MMSKIYFQKNIDTLLKYIKDEYDRHSDIINLLREENQKLKDEHYQNLEIQRLTSLVQELEHSSGFDISKEENEKILEWKQNHRHKSGAIGGNFKYEFIPTSIGTVGTITCSACKETFCFRELE